MGRSLALGLFVTLGCSPAELAVGIEWPRLEGSGTAVIVLQRGQRPLAAHVVEQGELPKLEFDVSSRSEPIEVYALEYDVEPSRLGLVVGPLAFGSGRSLPPPARVRRTQASLEGRSTWHADSLPTSISELRLEQDLDEACRIAFSPRIVDHELPGAGPENRLVFAGQLGPSPDVLLFHSGGRVYRVTGDGASIDETLSSTTSRFHAATQIADGSIVALRDRELLRIAPLGQVHRITEAPSPVAHAWIAARLDGDRLIILLLNERGAVERFDGGHWSHVGDLPVEPVEGEDSVAAFISLDEMGRALVLPPVYLPCSEGGALTCGLPAGEASVLWELDGDRFSGRTALPSAIVGGFKFEGRLMWATALGPIFDWVNGAWVERFNFAVRVGGAVETERGLLLTFSRQEIGLYNPAVGLCTLGLRHVGPPRTFSMISGGIVMGRQRDDLHGSGAERVSILFW